MTPITQELVFAIQIRLNLKQKEWLIYVNLVRYGFVSQDQVADILKVTGRGYEKMQNSSRVAIWQMKNRAKLPVKTSRARGWFLTEEDRLQEMAKLNNLIEEMRQK